MGRRIFELARQTPEISVTGVFERPGHPDIGREYTSELTVHGELESILPLGDVLVDFTEHTATLDHLKTTAKHGKAAVVGTTGFTPDETAEIRALTQYFSIGSCTQHERWSQFNVQTRRGYGKGAGRRI